MKKRLMKGGSMRTLAFIAIASLLLTGSIAFAYTTLWSGTASITIEVLEPPPMNGGGTPPPPDPEPLLELTVDEPTVTKGVIEGGVWTITLVQGESATISTHVRNPRDTEAWVELFTNGSGVNNITVSPGVTIGQLIGHGVVHSLAPESSLVIQFIIDVDGTAETGTLPDVLLEIREKE
ncbi:hypothetical protein LCGC14_3158610 [marine sediment metagenome]|uniref:Uncharacterized protein n=1 Tax=marine sediment metagenome TaxID=412755 RepID=A0A0F8WFZ2_9ZZZZ